MNSNSCSTKAIDVNSKKWDGLLISSLTVIIYYAKSKKYRINKMCKSISTRLIVFLIINYWNIVKIEYELKRALIDALICFVC